MFNVGDEVKWSSQSSGVSKVKVGKLIDIIAKGESAIRVLKKNTKFDPNKDYGKVKFQDKNIISDRYLVEVPRGGKSKLCDYYAPQMSVVDCQEIKRRMDDRKSL